MGGMTLITRVERRHLVIGAIFVLIGLSGVILAYREEIDEQLNAAIVRVEAPRNDAAYRPIDEIVAAAAADLRPPQRQKCDLA
jgi:uncharacterized iron-regulated membrane protein